MKKQKFVYLLYCNPTDRKLVYGVYQSKQKAIKYAIDLIRYRKEVAQRNNWEFGYYHFLPLPQRIMLNRLKDKDSFDYRKCDIFSACLKIKDGHKDNYSDDACHVVVERQLLM